ncbi:MAG: hypothetical protein QM765_34750 [Myxococcales bacterium]
MATGCAAGYGRPSGAAGALWVDATRNLSDNDWLPAVYVRVDDEPPQPPRAFELGAHAGIRVGYGVGSVGELPDASGISYEPEVQLTLGRFPFDVELHAGYLVQQMDYAGAPANSYAAPTASLTVGWAPTAWLGLHVGGGLLVDGKLEARHLDNPLFQNFQGSGNAWGGRVTAGVDLALFRGRNVGLDLRLDFEFTQTAEGDIQVEWTVPISIPFSVRRFGGAASLAWSFSAGSSR